MSRWYGRDRRMVRARVIRVGMDGAPDAHAPTSAHVALRCAIVRITSQPGFPPCFNFPSYMVPSTLYGDCANACLFSVNHPQSLAVRLTVRR